MASAPVETGRGPIADLNTTPLIDVMLVLLIMFIVTIPLATHAVKLNLPGPPRPDVRTEVNPTKNLVGITAAGQILWNGRAVDQAGLRARLGVASAMLVQPQLLFAPDSDARYELVDGVLADITRSGATRFAFVGNERYGSF